MYVDGTLEPRMAALNAERLKECGSGGIDDMTAIEVLGEYTKLRITNLCMPRDGVMFDDNLGCPDGFEMMLGAGTPAMLNVKNVRFRGGIPHVRKEDGSGEARFATLHFQGRKKQFMKACAAGSRARLEGAVRWRLARERAMDAYHGTRRGITGCLRRVHLLKAKEHAQV
jgi:hypothetical protein